MVLHVKNGCVNAPQYYLYLCVSLHLSKKCPETGPNFDIENAPLHSTINNELFVQEIFCMPQILAHWYNTCITCSDFCRLNRFNDLCLSPPPSLPTLHHLAIYACTSDLVTLYKASINGMQKKNISWPCIKSIYTQSQRPLLTIRCLFKWSVFLFGHHDCELLFVAVNVLLCYL